MNKKLIIPDEEQQTNVVPFAKPSSDGTDENWLAGLEQGTCFLARPKEDPKTFAQALQNQQVPGKAMDLMEYHVLKHARVSTLLYLCLPSGQNVRTHVDTLRFSRAMELVDVLGVTRPDNNEKENGTGD